MNSFLLGGIIGILLALLNFGGSIFISSRIIFRSKLTSVVLALGGFIARLTVVSLIFFVLSGMKAVHFQTALVSFISCFTICLAFKALQLYRKVGSLTWKQNER